MGRPWAASSTRRAIGWAGYFGSLEPGADPRITGGGNDPSGDALYQPKHNPIVYFAGYDPAAVKPLDALLDDLESPAPPQFALVVPDMADNMHDPVGSTAKDATAVERGDAWVAGLIRRVTATRWWTSGGIVLLVWDEAYDGSGRPVPGGIGDPPTDGGPVILMLIGAGLAGAARGAHGLGADGNWDGPLSHAGLLRSIETYFGLEPLNEAANPSYGDISRVLLSVAAAAPLPSGPTSEP